MVRTACKCICRTIPEWICYLKECCENEASFNAYNSKDLFVDENETVPFDVSHIYGNLGTSYYSYDATKGCVTFKKAGRFLVSFNVLTNSANEAAFGLVNAADEFWPGSVSAINADSFVTAAASVVLNVTEDMIGTDKAAVCVRKYTVPPPTTSKIDAYSSSLNIVALAPIR